MEGSAQATRDVVVDNRSGGDPAFAEELARDLRAGGFTVELRGPDPRALYDTFVHMVAEGVAVRVLSPADDATLSTLARIVRESEGRRRSVRRRFRSVPIYGGEGQRVLRWVDLFD